MGTYFVIISLRVATPAEFAFVSLSAFDVWQCVRLHVFLQVPLLGKFLISNISLKGLNPSVHPCMVKNIPGPGEFFISVAKPADVDHERFTIKLCAPNFGVVLEIFQQF